MRRLKILFSILLLISVISTNSLEADQPARLAEQEKSMQKAASRQLEKAEREARIKEDCERRARRAVEAQAMRKEALAKKAALCAERQEKYRIAKAEQELAKAQKKRLQTKIKTLYKTATVFYSTRQYDLAESAFNEILAFDPCNLLAKQYLKKIKARQKNFACKLILENRAREREDAITLSH
jgi:hypothetical protein